VTKKLKKSTQVAKRDKFGRYARSLPPSKKRPTSKPLPPSKKRPPAPALPPSKKRPVSKPLPPSKKRPITKPLPPSKKRPAAPEQPPIKKRPPSKPLPPSKKPARKKPKKKGPKVKRRYPSFMGNASKAETMIQDKLVSLGELIRLSESGLGISVKTFINADSTVDGELRVSDLPDEWRTFDGIPSIISAISECLRGAGAFPTDPFVGGAFWVSFGLRFGPKNMDEILEWAKEYKRFRGLLQVGAHHTTAQNLSAMLNNALALRMFIDRVWVKRSLPPAQILIRFVWTPTKVNPGRFSGEEGSTK
jgi:hypothetical protein